MSRPKLNPETPEGYPYILFKDENQFYLATSIIDARKKSNNKEIKAVNINELVSANGHSRANSMLRNIGSTWTCKGGKIFFGF